MKLSPRVRAAARRVKLIAMDVDGVLTGGEIIVLRSGEEVKFWNVKDGMGFYLLRRSKAPVRLAWLTGRASRQVEERARESRVDELFVNCMKKRDALEKILKKYRLSPEEVAYIGDDLVDVPVFRIAGLAICPSDASDEVKKEADLVSSLAGGKGVAREVVEIILKAQGFWKKATEGYLS